MQENITYYDDTRYDNLTSLVSNKNENPDKLSAKLAKLSALDKVENSVNKIKSELKNQVEKTETVSVTPEVTTETPSVEVTPEVNVEPEVTTAEETTPVEEPKIEYPSKESLEARTNGIEFYNDFDEPSAETLGRKLRVAPQVTDSMDYARNTLGVDYVPENVETSVDTTEEEVEPTVDMNAPFEMPAMEIEPEVEATTNVEPEVESEVSVDTPEEQPQTFDFSALPGVGETNELPEVNNNFDYSQEETTMEEQPTYEDHMTTEEQDNRLNDYLNRDTTMDTQTQSSNITDLEEIRRLKREIEEARRSLQQVKGNVSDLQQKDNRISEQLAMLKQDLIAQKDAVNQEILAETTEWNNLTQLVREKEALMSEEDLVKSRAA